MYRSITLARGGDEVVFACNKEYEGLFSYARGRWTQHIGTCDTPRFRDRHHLSRWIRHHISSPVTRWEADEPMSWAGWRMVGSQNWD